jgi:opacity protein-like surface antigen
MRLMSSAALALAATLVASPAFAQASFSIAGGLTMPVGSTADAVQAGYNGIVGLTIKPPLAPLGLRLEGMYNANEYKSGTVLAGATNRIVAGIVNGTLSGAGMPIPMGYLIAGLGMYNVKATDLPANATSSGSTEVGFNVGAGLNFPLTGFSTFLEARFHLIASEGESMNFIPITFGIKF